MKKISTLIALITIVILQFSCQKDGPTPLGIQDKAIAFELGDSIVQIASPKIQIIDSAKKGYQSLSVKSNSGSTDILLLIKYAKNINPVGIHLLGSKDKEGIPYSQNKILVYERKGQMLNAFNSSSCQKHEGQIEITQFDAKKNTLSGNFQSKVCSVGGIGVAGHKTIHRGAFKNVPFELYQTKK